MLMKMVKKAVSLLLVFAIMLTTVVMNDAFSTKVKAYEGVKEIYDAQVWLNENYTGKGMYDHVAENGIVSKHLMYSFGYALGIELGTDHIYGDFDNETMSKLPTLRYGNENIYVKILQHALYCKGYNPAKTTGYFDKNTKKAVENFQSDVGFKVDGIVTPTTFKALLNENSFVLNKNGDKRIRKIQQTLNKKYNKYFYQGSIPCDGVYWKKTNEAFVLALQAEMGVLPKDSTIFYRKSIIENDLILKKGDTRKGIVYILQYALYVNGYDPGDFDGIYDTQVENAIKEFQRFMHYPEVTGIADVSVIQGLFYDGGDESRLAKVCEYDKNITPSFAMKLKNKGYNIVARNIMTNDSSYYKNLTSEEIDVILESGLKFVPIFKTSKYLTQSQGENDANRAFYVADALGIPSGTTIYFAVIGDRYPNDHEEKTCVLDYFKSLNSKMQSLGNKYKIGIYAHRNTCTQVSDEGYAVNSFVNNHQEEDFDYSVCRMPDNWAFDNFSGDHIGSGEKNIYVDKINLSGRDKGVGKVEKNSATDYSKIEKVPSTYFADPIDLSQGAHVIDTELMSLNGGQNLSLDLTYNGAFLSNGLTGIGWTTNYSKKLEINEAEIKVFADDNSFSVFKLSEETNKYVTNAKGKKGYILTKNNDGSYELNCNNNQKEYYDKTGKLVKIEDKNNRVITLDNTDSTIKIIDSLTQKYLLLTKNSDGKIVSVKDSADRTVTLTYQKDCLASITDISGNKTLYTYDGKGRILTGTDSDGVCFFTNTYDEKGRITSQKDAIENSKKSLFEYDDTLSDGQLSVKAINRNGVEKNHLFNKDNLLIKMTDANNNTTKYQYDDNGNLTKEIDSLGNEIVKTYSDTNKVLTEKDKLGNTTTYTYDKKDNLTKITYPDGTNKSFIYNEDNLLTSLIDIREVKTKYLYDENNLLVENNENGRKTRLSYVDGMLVSEINPSGKKQSYSYNKFGFVETVTDYIGNKTKYEYDKKGQVIKVINAKGNTTSNVYDSNGNVILSKDTNGNETKYKYNGNLKLISKTLPNGGMIKYEYDGEDRLIKITDANGNASQTVYDNVGRIVEKIDSEGSKTLFEYDSLGNVVKQVNPNGGVILSSYDANGNLISQTDANKNTTKYEYDKLSRLIKIINAKGGEILNTYNNVGDLISVTDPLKNKINYQYNDFGELSSLTDAKGNVTKFSYDNCGNLINIVDALGNKTSNQYDGNNRLIATTDAKGNKQTFTYDEVGNIITETDAKGNTVSKTYDANGNVLTITDSKGVVQLTNKYNSMNLPTSQIRALRFEIENIYDLQSNLICKKNNPYVDKKFEYDKVGRIKNATSSIADSEFILTKSHATYDAEGNLIEMEGPLGGKIKYTYDKSGRMTSESTPSNGTINYEYNSLNKKSKITNARGQAKELAYDKSGKVTAYKNNEGNASFTYDKNGNVLIKRDSKGTVTREYDELNRVTKYTNALAETIKYEYDEVGNVKKLIYPDNTAVKYDYDENNNLIKVTDWNGRVTSYTYDENDNVTSVSKPDGSITETKYDDAQRVISTLQRLKTGEIIQIYQYKYDYDGRLYSEMSLAPDIENEYSYDTLNRISSVSNSKTSQTFFHDEAGNILDSTKQENGNECTNEHVYDKNNKLISYTENRYNQNFELISCDEKNFAYDLDGNMIFGFIGQKNILLSYDSDNRLIKAGNNSYTYDAENIRVQNLCGNEKTTYTYNTNSSLSQLLMKKDKDGNVTKYVYGLGLIGEESEGAFKTYHFDYRGSTTAITNEKGQVIDTFEYDTYGKLTNRTGSTKTIFMYNGCYGVVTDSNGLLYMRARYYSPELKRFINADIIKGDITNNEVLNKYAYVNGNPVSNIDPFGLFSWKTFGKKALDVGFAGLRIAGGALQIGAGLAMSTTGIGAVAGAFMMANGACEMIGGVAEGANTTLGKNWHEENYLKTGVKTLGKTVGGETGELIGGLIYEGSNFVSSGFSAFQNGAKLVSETSKKAIKVPSAIKYLKNMYKNGNGAAKNLIAIDNLFRSNLDVYANYNVYNPRIRYVDDIYGFTNRCRK